RIHGAFARRGMAAENWSQQIGIATAHAIENLKQLDHPSRVITDALQIVEAQIIRFALGIAAVSHQRAARDQAAGKLPQIASRASGGSRRSADQSGDETILLRAFDILQPVTRNDMADFMAEHTRELRFVLRRREQPGMNINVTAERGE